MATSVALAFSICALLFGGWKGSTAVASPVVQDRCQDHVGAGMTCKDIPHFCASPYAADVCPLTCSKCALSTTVPTSKPVTTIIADGCHDKIVNGLSCRDLHNFCSDPYAPVLCRETCNFCVPETQTASHTPSLSTASYGPSRTSADRNSSLSTASHTLSLAAPSASVPPGHGRCRDHLWLGVSCQNLPHICHDQEASVLCAATCSSDCPSSSTSLNWLPGEAEDPCHDNVVNGLACELLPRTFCANPYAPLVCRKYCNFCESRSDQASVHSTTSRYDEGCVNDVENEAVCNHPHFCSSPFAKKVCRKSCGLCCEDHLLGPETCLDLKEKGVDPCGDPLGREACAKFCGVCTA